MFLNNPVMYLQRSDFNDNGDIINEEIVDKQPVMIMIQAGFCGHCTKAKPEFQEFADKNKGIITAATIQADGTMPGERELNEIINKIDPEFKGFPSYILYNKGKRIHYEGPRDSKSIEAFCK